MPNTQRPLSVLMFPWLAHGHTSPFLELAKKLTANNFHIFFCSTPANLDSVKNKMGVEYSDSIQIVELHLPSLPQLPQHYHTTNGLPPHLMSTLKQAFEMSKPEFSSILETLKPDLLVFDFNQPWAADLANSYNIPAVEFLTFTPSMVSFYIHYHRYISGSDSKYPFPEIYLNSHEHRGIHQLKEGEEGRVLECINKSKLSLFKTFREIEGKYLDYLETFTGKKMVATGPLVEQPVDEVEVEDEFTNWLNNKEPRSTVFVSFGSEYYSSKEEMEEIAIGLEMSEVNFIWVVRFPLGDHKRSKIEENLPNGFIERVRNRGLVVEGWAPQMRILKHGSIGGFVSHCGTSSVMESFKVGVPIVAMPMHLDQPLNARLVVSLGVAVEVERDSEGRFCKEEVAKGIRKVVVGEDGKDLRRKAKEMSCLLMKKGDEDIDVVVKELTQLCKEA